MKIIVDAMGGDNAPDEIIKGAILAVEECDIEVVLVGKEELISDKIKDYNKISVINATEVVEMCDNPSTTLRDKPNSSLAISLAAMKEGGDALVSAGNTGALLSGANFKVGRIKGIKRAALSPVLPTKSGGSLLIDCGANLECKPEYLLQFAMMGGIYAKTLFNKHNPTVGLLNIGAEETKGCELQKEAYQLLKQASADGKVNFVGNVEGRDIAFGACDVVVADGYSGNILLKTTEGLGLYFADMLKDMFYKNTKTKIGALLVKDGIRDFKKKLDYTEVGGSPFLGVNKPVIKAHGSSNAKAIKNAILGAKKFCDSGVIGEIAENIEAMKIQITEKQTGGIAL